MPTDTLVFDVDRCSSNAAASVYASASVAGFADLREALGVEPGTHFRVIYPVETAAQAYFWTSHWQAGEREADEDIASGRTKVFSSIDDAIAWLEGPED